MSIIPFHERMQEGWMQTACENSNLHRQLCTSGASGNIQQDNSTGSTWTRNMQHWGKATVPGKTGVSLLQMLALLYSQTPKHHSWTHHPSSHLNLLNQHVLCSTGWLLHFHNLQSPKYCYQRPRVNLCREGYSLALHNHIFSSSVSLKRKKYAQIPKTRMTVMTHL